MTQPEDLDYLAPEADAAEQSLDANPGEDDGGWVSDDLEAPDWDAHEQSRTVSLDDEGYR
jgi:hypothetical protein